MLSLGCLEQYWDKAFVFSVKRSGSSTGELFLCPKYPLSQNKNGPLSFAVVFSQNCSHVIAEKSTAGSVFACAFASWTEHANMTKHSAVTDFMAFLLSSWSLADPIDVSARRGA
jgi:hypothetical protein